MSLTFLNPIDCHRPQIELLPPKHGSLCSGAFSLNYKLSTFKLWLQKVAQLRLCFLKTVPKMSKAFHLEPLPFFSRISNESAGWPRQVQIGAGAALSSRALPLIWPHPAHFGVLQPHPPGHSHRTVISSSSHNPRNARHTSGRSSFWMLFIFWLVAFVAVHFSEFLYVSNMNSIKYQDHPSSPSWTT